MNVIAQKMAEFSSGQQLNAKAGFNPGGQVYRDKLTFDSLISTMKNDTLNFAGIRRQNVYNGNRRIESRPDRQAGIDGREYNRGSGEIKGRPEQPDGNREINGPEYGRSAERKDEFSEIDNRNAGHKADEIEKDTGKPEAASGEKRVNGNNSEMRENGRSEESPVDESEATINEEAGGEGNTDDILLELLNTLTGESTDNVLNGSGKASGKSGSGEGAVDGPKTMASLNGIHVKSVNSKINPANSENTEAVSSALTGLDNNIKKGVLLSETPGESADKKGAAGLENLINAQAKSGNTDSDDSEEAFRDVPEQSGKNADLKKEHIKEIKEIKSVKDAVEQDIREGNNSAKELNNKPVSEFTGNLNREGGLKNHVNNDARPLRVESGNNNAGLPNNSSAGLEGGKISGSLHTANVSKPTAFNEVIDKIVYVAKGDNRLGVTIEHKDLGKLNISLSLEKGMVNVHINTADKAAKEFVENNIQQIIDSLSKNGVSVGGFSVGLKNQGNSEGNGNRKQNDLDAGGEKENEYFKASNNVSLNNGLVNIFA